MKTEHGHSTPTQGATGSDLVEIRVHGVGDHDYLSALGLPPIEELNSWTVVSNPPKVPDHNLRIINWSRSNRQYTRGVLWYLAFPFTLVNVAGRMSPPGAQGSRLLAVLVALAGVVLTLSQLTWVVVLAETVLQYVPVTVNQALLGQAVVALGALVLGGSMVVRQRRRPPANRASPMLLWIHILPLLLFAALLIWLRPVQLNYSGWPSTLSLGPGAGGSSGAAQLGKLDAMAAWVVGSTVLMLLIGAILLLPYWLGGRKRRADRAPMAIAGGLLVLGMMLMHSVTALVRMATDAFFAYLDGLFWPSPAGALEYGNRILMAYDHPRLVGDNRLDLLPLLALLLLFCLLAAAALWTLHPNVPSLHGLFGGLIERAKWWPRLIGSVPFLLPRALPLAVALAAPLIVLAVINAEQNENTFWFALGTVLLHVAAAAVLLTAFLGQLSRVREVMGQIADMAGFWPVRDHPLASVSYRRPVIAGIREEIDDHDPHKVVLVGHSQGAVLCAWLVSGHGGDQMPAGVHLVTCGAPLVSVYQNLFPAHFTESFFTDVARRSASWKNFWRQTDPIGTAVPAANNERLPDPRPGEPLQGHSNYWIDERQNAYIESLEPGTK